MAHMYIWPCVLTEQTDGKLQKQHKLTVSGGRRELTTYSIGIHKSDLKRER